MFPPLFNNIYIQYLHNKSNKVEEVGTTSRKWEIPIKPVFLLTLTALILCIALIAPQVIATILPQKTDLDVKSTTNDSFGNDWYYLPSYPNYAPSGLPDFDQKQDNWMCGWRWTFCAPTALADVLWWFDSKHSDPNGTPGDGIDTFPLVNDYSAPGTPYPGPHSDDHNFNNVNDGDTPWLEINAGELIERIAWYVNTNRCRNPLNEIAGTGRFYMKWGARKWIRDAGLQDVFKVTTIFRPRFSTINERLRNNEGIILRLGYYYNDGPKWYPLLHNHQVAVAGISSDGYIAISDPVWDVANPDFDPIDHNDASIVSHDIYEVSFQSPCPLISSWWIPEFAHHRIAVVLAATIISEIN